MQHAEAPGQRFAGEWNAVNSCHAEGLGGNSFSGIDEELLAWGIHTFLSTEI